VRRELLAVVCGNDDGEEIFCFLFLSWFCLCPIYGSCYFMRYVCLENNDGCVMNEVGVGYGCYVLMMMMMMKFWC
jgi:hypothetical protein